jgi:hypothetical protein
MTHIPGSWKAYPADTDSTPHFGHLASDIWGITDSGDTAIVARVYHAETSSQANENLILAAPDLLAALKEWISMAVNSGLEGCDEILEQAEAAIDKATKGLCNER